MRVLLVHPPLLPAGEVTPPLGLCTLASWLLRIGHEVRVLDLDLETKGLSQPSRQYLEIFALAMLDFQPQAVGLTSMYSNSLQAECLLRAAKRLDGGVITVAGGSHFGALGCQALNRISELDYAIQGEAEPSLNALLSGVPPAEIPRLQYRQDGEIHANPSRGLMNLADLPPMWITLPGVVPLERYAATIRRLSPRRMIYIEAGRGCPFACTFCATAPFWEQRYRVKPVERIVDEIRYLHEEFGYDSFILVHDLLTANAKFMSSFCDAMLDSRLPVEWMANSRTDIRLRGLLPKLKAAGCWKLFYGVESASGRVQEAIDKHLKMDEALETLQDLTEHGISATTSFVMGFPDETEEELSSTIALGARLKLMGIETVQYHRLRLFPPSRLCRTITSGEFDADSLKLEYPFLDIPPDEMGAIQSDREFFSGYWTPGTTAGTSLQLAQVEMFFHHTVALLPLTTAAAAKFAGPSLISSFYKAIEDWRPLQRENLDWETGDFWRNWMELRPLLETWVRKELAIEDWQAEILEAVFTYEVQRIGFVGGKDLPSPLVQGPGWAAFHSALDLPETLERMRMDRPLTRELLSPTVVVFKRRADERFEAYTLDRERIPDLLQLDPDLVSVLQNGG